MAASLRSGDASLLMLSYPSSFIFFLQVLLILCSSLLILWAATFPFFGIFFTFITPPSSCLFVSSLFYVFCEITVLYYEGDASLKMVHTHTHTHINQDTLKLQGRSLALGYSCQSNKLQLGGGYGGFRAANLLLGRYEHVCMWCVSYAPIICVMRSLFSVSTLCVYSSLCILNFCLLTLSII